MYSLNLVSNMSTFEIYFIVERPTIVNNRQHRQNDKKKINKRVNFKQTQTRFDRIFGHKKVIRYIRHTYMDGIKLWKSYAEVNWELSFEPKFMKIG